MGAVSLLVGQTAMWGLTITGDDGLPGNVGVGPLATVTLPGGTTDEATVSNPAPGVYVAAYVPTVPGVHWVQWSGSGANSGGLPQVEATMVEAPAGLIAVNTWDLAGHLRADLGNEDELRVAQDICARGSAIVRRWCDTARLATATPDEVAVVQTVMLRVCARMWSNPLDRASYTGPEGLSYVTTSPRILTDDEKAQLATFAKLSGFA